MTMNKGQQARLLRGRKTGSAPELPHFTSVPEIAYDTLEVGGTGVASTPTFEPADATLVAEWVYEDGSAIVEADDTRVWAEADVGLRLTRLYLLQVSGVTVAQIACPLVGPIQPAAVTPPIGNVVLPAISTSPAATYRVGVAMQAVIGTYDQAVALVGRQWLRATTALGAGAVPIAGQGGASFLPTPAEEDGFIAFDETVGAGGDEVTFRSAWVGPVVEALTGSNDPALTSPAMDDTGSYLEFNVSGGTWSSKIITVNPGLIALTMNVAGSDAAGADVTLTLARRMGLRADYVAGKLRLWVSEPVPANATNVSVLMLPNALTTSTGSTIVDHSGSWQGDVDNGSRFVSPKPEGWMLSAVMGRHSAVRAYGLLDAPFSVEAFGVHNDGIACCEFDIVDSAGASQTFRVTEQTRSRYQDDFVTGDRKVITDAQWIANAGGGALQGGIGVYATPLIDPDGLAEGLATVTWRCIPRNGGRANARVDTWQVCIDRGGYAERVRYVDPSNFTGVASDANSGLDAAHPLATLQAAVKAAGSRTAGATARTAPIVKVVGSGNPLAPLFLELYDETDTVVANLAGETETWTVVEAAEGHDATDVVICNYGDNKGRYPRVRRLKFRNLGWDLADVAGAASTSGNALLQLGPANPYNVVTNPPAFEFEEVRRFHHNGREGQTVQGYERYFAPEFANVRTYFHRFESTDHNGSGFQVDGVAIMRDSWIHDVCADVSKAFRGAAVATPFCDAGPPPRVLGYALLNGSTPTPGMTFTGLLSGVTFTVETFSAGAIVTTAPHTYSLKPDDNGTHQYATTGAVTGAITVGQTFTGPGVAGVVRAIGDGFVRVNMTLGSTLAAGATITTATGSATTTAASATRGNLLFSNGATAQPKIQHIDGLQVQKYVDQNVTLESVLQAVALHAQVHLGEFQTAGSGITRQNYQLQVDAVSLDEDGRTVWRCSNQEDISLSSRNPSTGDSPRTQTLYLDSDPTNLTPVATVRKLRHAVYDLNMLLYCCDFRGVDGQTWFGENGSTGAAFVNCLGCVIDLTKSASSGTSWVYGAKFWHVTHANQQLGEGTVRGYGASGASFRWSISRSFGSNATPSSASPKLHNTGSPGVDFYCCHTLSPSDFNALLDGMTTGQVAWTDGTLVTEEFDEARMELIPTSNAGLARVAAGELMVRFDYYGRERANDGSAVAGALEPVARAA